MRVAVKGGDLNVVCFRGSAQADAPVVLALHGWALDHRLFAPQVEALGGHYRLVALDRRGFGASTAPPDLRREVEDIDRVLDALAIDKTHLLGVSQGGRIALRYTARAPERLLSLTLLGAAVDHVETAEPLAERLPIDEFATLARAGRMEEVHSRWLAHPMMQPRPEDPALDALLRRMVHDYAGRDLRDVSPQAYAWNDDVLAGVSRLSAPALLLTGEHETPARKRQARVILKHLRNGREAVLRGAGHLANLIVPQRFNDALIAHLANSGCSARAAD